MGRRPTLVAMVGVCAVSIAAHAGAPSSAREGSADYPVLSSSPTGQSGEPATLRVQSTVQRIRIGLLRRLPRAPASASADARADCQHLLSPPKTAAGRRVADAGWGVTGEVSVGPYQAVSFVGVFEPGTSGSCELGEGNIGLFRDTELAAIVYASDSRKSVGYAHPLETGGLRIWDGDFPSQPVADLRIGSDNTMMIQPLSAQETVCNGAARVPNVYGRPINRARTLLIQSGWLPAATRRSSREQMDDRVNDLLRRGISEVEACSGTGFGFCAYTYKTGSTVLSVTTAGEGAYPVVSNYEARCRAPG